MKAKFLGVCLIAAGSAILCMDMSPQADAGLFRRMMRAQYAGAYASCSGGGGLQAAPFGSCSGGGGLQAAPFASCSGGGGLQSAVMYSSCSGSGGGLQSAAFATTYVDCSGGGGGGGLQSFYPSYAVPSYTPTYYNYSMPYSSGGGCPGGMCPAPGGLSYYAPAPATRYIVRNYVAPPVPVVRYSMPSVPAGVRLNPGESYVAGSLRPVQRTYAAPPVERSVAASSPKPRTGTFDAPADKDPFATPQKGFSEYRLKSDGRANVLPPGYVVVQVSQHGEGPCVPCNNDRKLLDAEGVPFETLFIDGTDAEKELLRGYCRDLGMPTSSLDATPQYFLIADGKATLWKPKPFRDRATVKENVRIVWNDFDAWRGKAETAAAGDKTSEKLDVVIDLLTKQTDSINKLVETVGVKAAAK